MAFLLPLGGKVPVVADVGDTEVTISAKEAAVATFTVAAGAWAVSVVEAPWAWQTTGLASERGTKRKRDAEAL